MNDIGWGILLNLIYWIGVASALLFFGVWALVEFCLGAWRKIMENIRVVSGRKTYPHPFPAREEVEEPYRKAS